MKTKDYSEIMQETDVLLRVQGRRPRHETAKAAGVRIALVHGYMNGNSDTVDNIARLIIQQHKDAAAAGIDESGTVLEAMAMDAGCLLVSVPQSGAVDCEDFEIAAMMADEMGRVFRAIHQAKEDGIIEPHELRKCREEINRYMSMLKKLELSLEKQCEESNRSTPVNVYPAGEQVKAASGA